MVEPPAPIRTRSECYSYWVARVTCVTTRVGVYFGNLYPLMDGVACIIYPENMSIRGTRDRSSI